MAVVVGVVPGYFWAKCLSSSADHAERIAYSAALSITLVPTAALLQVRVFDTGVTLFITAVSIFVVFATGFAVYLWLGPTSSADQPIFDLSPTPPGTLALM